MPVCSSPAVMESQAFPKPVSVPSTALPPVLPRGSAPLQGDPFWSHHFFNQVCVKNIDQDPLLNRFFLRWSSHSDPCNKSLVLGEQSLSRPIPLLCLLKDLLFMFLVHKDCIPPGELAHVHDTPPLPSPPCASWSFSTCTRPRIGWLLAACLSQV